MLSSAASLARALSRPAPSWGVKKRVIPFSVATPDLGARLMLAREWRGLSKADLARELGVTPSAVSQWEKGTTEPGVAVMLRFKALHQVSLDWIYAEDRTAISGDFLRFIADFGARPDAPRIAREMRIALGLPAPTHQGPVAAAEVAEAIIHHHPATPARRGRPPRHTLHEDQAEPED